MDEDGSISKSSIPNTSTDKTSNQQKKKKRWSCAELAQRLRAEENIKTKNQTETEERDAWWKSEVIQKTCLYLGKEIITDI